MRLSRDGQSQGGARAGAALASAHSPVAASLRAATIVLAAIFLLAAPLALGGCGHAGGPVSAAESAQRAAAERAATAPAHTDKFITAGELERIAGEAGRVAADVGKAASGASGGSTATSGATGAARPVVAAVVPHHLVAGQLPAGLFAYLAADPPDTLVVIGPDHDNAGPPIATSFGGWQTPGGRVEVDPDLTAALLDEDIAGEAWAVQDNEHSVGALMPLVRRYLPQTRVVALTVRRDVSPAQATALGRFLAQWSGSRIFVVASVDFSHYLRLAEAQRRDEDTIAALEAGDWTALFGLGASNLDSPASLAAAFTFAGNEDSPDFSVVEHTNSATLLGQPDLASTTSHFLILIRAGAGT